MPKKPELPVRGLYQRTPGVWWIHYYDAAGRRHRMKGGTYAAARSLLDHKLAEKRLGLLPRRPQAAAVTFEQITKDAIAHAKRKNGAQSVQELQQKYDLLNVRIGDRAASELRAGDFERALDEIEAHKRESKTDKEWSWSSATRNRWRAALSLAYKVAVNNDTVPSNPIKKVVRLQEDNGRVRYLNEEEEKNLRLAVEVKWPEHLAVLDILLNTGMRRNELLTLRWENISFERKQLELRITKNGDRRYIPLNAKALSALEALRAAKRSPLWVMADTGGNRIESVRYWFEAAVKEAGIQDFHLHDLRHCFASKLAMAGVPMKTIATLLGHRSLAMTWRYSHLSPDHLQEAVERI